MRVFAVLLSVLASCQTAPPLMLTPSTSGRAINPDRHVVFENEYLRAVEHHLPAGTRILLDGEDMPQLLVSLNKSVLRVHGSAARDLSLKSAEVVWNRSGMDVVENMGTDQAVVLMIELKQSRPLARAVLQADDGTTVAPDVYRLLFENDLVRAIDVHFAPGQSTPMHSHPGWAFRYRLSSMRSRITLPDGRVIDSEYRPGSAAWTQELSRHAYENVGTTAGHVLLVELK